MGILDGIVEWIAEQVMAGLDLVTTSVLGALGCDMAVFLRYFPAAETMYSVFVALAIGIILLNWVWQLFKNFGLGAGVEAEDPVKLSIRSVIFILLTLFSDEIVNIVLTIGGTPYHWIMDSDLPALSFADFNSVMLVIIGVCANGAVALITLILVLILAWNYLKLLFEAAERYVLLGVLVYTAPVAFSMGASQTTANIWKSWCRMLGGQIFLLVMNAWCLRLFTSMVGSFLANPRHPLPLDHGVRPSCIKLCRLQFRDAGHHRCVCQWGCGADYLDFGSHPRLELPKTSVRGSRTVCAARCTGLHGSRGFFYGRQPNHSKHLEILVPDAWRSNFPIGHERLVPAPVHKHGGVLPCEPAFVVRRSYP